MTLSSRKARPKGPDPAEVEARLLDLCAHYAGGPGKRSGRRVTWVCPGCGKPKLEALPESGLAGCWNAACAVPTSTGALGLVAFFENLDRRREFPELLRRAGEVLGLETQPSRPQHKSPPPARPDGHGYRGAPDAAGDAGNLRPERDPDLLDAVYTGLLALCPLSERDLRFWASRGVGEGTARAGFFASATRARVEGAIRVLLEEFGREALLRVPGFFTNRKDLLSFTLTGDYQLIPYADHLGRVATIEGRATENQRAAMARRGLKAKYVSLRNSGSHLYLFPGLRRDAIEAFTEGTVGAIVAAQEGMTVGAIKGVRCYRGPGGGPLPELAGADLSGRIVPFVPDADDPPNPDVLEAAPKAARALTEPHGGRPALAYLPRGLDLDEWLLSLPPEKRRPLFDELLLAAVPPPEEAGAGQPSGQPRGGHRGEPRGRHPPPPP